MEHYTFHSFAHTRSALLANEFSATELTEFYLRKAETEDKYNAFRGVFRDSALALAKKVDEKVKAGTAGKLAGAIIGIKDNICYEGHKVGAASKILEGFESLFSATAVERLLAEDAIIIGRLNCDEFAMGSSNENSAFGGVKNPIDLDRVPGGSSGGSAAAMGAGLCMATLGSDTGGSIRQPAAFCNVVGLKPTYGRISRYGLIAFASSFDQIGPFTKTVEDSEMLFNIMAGRDEMDSTSSVKPLETVAKTKDKYHFVYYNEVLESSGMHPEIKQLFVDKIAALKVHLM